MEYFVFGLMILVLLTTSSTSQCIQCGIIQGARTGYCNSSVGCSKTPFSMPRACMCGDGSFCSLGCGNPNSKPIPSYAVVTVAKCDLKDLHQQWQVVNYTCSQFQSLTPRLNPNLALSLWEGQITPSSLVAL